VAVVLGLGLLLMLGPLAPSASAATPVPVLDSTFSTLLNGLRSTLGLGSLTVDSELSDIARAWSVQMANSGVMSHNPALTTQAQSWAKLGENVGYGPAVLQIFNALVASPPHMRNMSDPEFTRIGVGTVTDSQGTVWTTHVFMRPKAAVAATPLPPVAPPTTKAPAPSTTKAPPPTAPATTVAPPPTVPPPTTAAPVPVTTTVAPVPIAVEVAGAASPTQAEAPVAPPVVLASARHGSERGPALPLMAGLGLVLVAMAGAGFLIRRSITSERHPPSPAAGSAEDLTAVLDLL